MPSGPATATICCVIWMSACDGVGSPDEHQNDGGGGQFERAFDHLARIDRSVIDRAGLLHFVGNQLIALVEKQNAELLLLCEALRAAAIVEHRRPG
jgi:hypothetical protein